MQQLSPFDKIEIVRKSTELTSTQKLIMLVIATHLGKNDFCYVSLSTLQKECCLAKRNAIIDNIAVLVHVDFMWKIPPSEGFKSNRYGINFQKLVTVGYQCGNPKLPVQSPTVTRLVTDGYPKRNINKSKRNLKKGPIDNFEEKAEKAKKAIHEIRHRLRIKRHEEEK